MDKLWTRYTELLPKLWEFQKIALRQETPHRKLKVRKQEMLGNAHRTIPGRCRKDQIWEPQ
jgi:hypothetical protein